MSSKLSKGITLTSRERCIEKIVSFEIIYKIIINNELDTPIYQTHLNTDKVNEMIESYHNNPDYLIFKNKIVIGDIITGNKKYILDGQHRIEMAKQIYEKDKTNDFLNFCYFEIKEDKDMKELFNEVNKDSLKTNHSSHIDKIWHLAHRKLCTVVKKEGIYYFS